MEGDEQKFENIPINFEDMLKRTKSKDSENKDLLKPEEKKEQIEKIKQMENINLLENEIINKDENSNTQPKKDNKIGASELPLQSEKKEIDIIEDKLKINDEEKKEEINILEDDIKINDEEKKEEIALPIKMKENAIEEDKLKLNEVEKKEEIGVPIKKEEKINMPIISPTKESNNNSNLNELNILNEDSFETKYQKLKEKICKNKENNPEKRSIADFININNDYLNNTNKPRNKSAAKSSVHSYMEYLYKPHIPNNISKPKENFSHNFTKYNFSTATPSYKPSSTSSIMGYNKAISLFSKTTDNFNKPSHRIRTQNYSVSGTRFNVNNRVNKPNSTSITQIGLISFKSYLDNRKKRETKRNAFEYYNNELSYLNSQLFKEKENCFKDIGALDKLSSLGSSNTGRFNYKPKAQTNIFRNRNKTTFGI